MKYYSQYCSHDLFELQESLSGLSKFHATFKMYEQQKIMFEPNVRSCADRDRIKATFGTSKRVYRANDIQAKLDKTADTWIGACFFAKNAMKFLRGLLCLIVEKSGLMALKIKIIKTFDDLVGVWTTPQVCVVKIN